jgi:hypothetical protein
MKEAPARLCEAGICMMLLNPHRQEVKLNNTEKQSDQRIIAEADVIIVMTASRCRSLKLISCRVNSCPLGVNRRMFLPKYVFLCVDLCLTLVMVGEWEQVARVGSCVEKGDS